MDAPLKCVCLHACVCVYVFLFLLCLHSHALCGFSDSVSALKPSKLSQVLQEALISFLCYNRVKYSLMAHAFWVTHRTAADTHMLIVHANIIVFASLYDFKFNTDRLVCVEKVIQRQLNLNYFLKTYKWSNKRLNYIMYYTTSSYRVVKSQ